MTLDFVCFIDLKVHYIISLFLLFPISHCLQPAGVHGAVCVECGLGGPGAGGGGLQVIATVTSLGGISHPLTAS